MLKNFGRFALLRLGATLIVLLAPLQLLYAQYDNGSLVGAIRDASGATIAKADVTITNSATGIGYDTKTDDGGNYAVPELRRYL